MLSDKIHANYWFTEKSSNLNNSINIISITSVLQKKIFSEQNTGTVVPISIKTIMRSTLFLYQSETKNFFLQNYKMIYINSSFIYVHYFLLLNGVRTSDLLQGETLTCI